MKNRENREKRQVYRAQLREKEAEHQAAINAIMEDYLSSDCEPQHYLPQKNYARASSNNLYEEIEHALHGHPLGGGNSCNAYQLHGAFEGHVLNIKRTELKTRLSASTILYPTHLTTANIAAPLWMNESGSIQIQPLMGGSSLETLHSQLRDHYRLKHAHREHAPVYASTQAYYHFLQTALAIPDAEYVQYLKSIAEAARDGLMADLHSRNVFFEDHHVRAIDFHHRDRDQDIPLPSFHGLMGSFNVTHDRHLVTTPSVEHAYHALEEKMEHVVAQANNDPEIRALLGEQQFTHAYIRPRHHAGTWLDREHGRALSEITGFAR